MPGSIGVCLRSSGCFLRVGMSCAFERSLPLLPRAEARIICTPRQTWPSVCRSSPACVRPSDETSSHMAQDWVLQYGILGVAESEALYKQVCKRKGIQPAAHAPALSNSPAKAKKVRRRPRSSCSKIRCATPLLSSPRRCLESDLKLCHPPFVETLRAWERSRDELCLHRVAPTVTHGGHIYYLAPRTTGITAGCMHHLAQGLPPLPPRARDPCWAPG